MKKPFPYPVLFQLAETWGHDSGLACSSSTLFIHIVYMLPLLPGENPAPRPDIMTSIKFQVTKREREIAPVMWHERRLAHKTATERVKYLGFIFSLWEVNNFYNVVNELLGNNIVTLHSSSSYELHITRDGFMTTGWRWWCFSISRTVVEAITAWQLQLLNELSRQQLKRTPSSQ